MRAIIILTAIIVAAPTWAQQKYSILQGSTSDKVTHFTIVAPAGDDLKFEIIGKEESNPRSPVRHERAVHPNSDWVVHRLKFNELTSRRAYVLRTIERATNHVVDQRNFKTLIMSEGAGRIAFVSCMLRQLHNPFLWNNLEKPANRPDLMLFLGDSVYLDRSSLLIPKLPKSTYGVWEDFVKSRNKLNVYRWENLVPIVSIWDDHDSGGDNVNARDYELMAKIRDIYETFFANEEIPGTLTKGPGLSKQFEAFGKNFIMLDGRSYREVSEESPLFGVAQDRWAFAQIKPGANLMVSGSQFFGASLRKDSLESNWPEYARIFAKNLREEGERRDASFVFVSGDIHFSEIQHIEAEIMGYPTVEITSSSAHSTIVPGYHLIRPNKRRSSAVSTHNVLLMELDTAVTTFDFKVRALTWRGKMPFAEDITVRGPCENYLTLKQVL